MQASQCRLLFRKQLDHPAGDSSLDAGTDVSIYGNFPGFFRAPSCQPTMSWVRFCCPSGEKNFVRLSNNEGGLVICKCNFMFSSLSWASLIVLLLCCQCPLGPSSRRVLLPIFHLRHRILKSFRRAHVSQMERFCALYGMSGVAMSRLINHTRS